MFDIGFSELVIIALVGLIVIGPERMPKVARTLGHLLGRLQRYVSDVKSDINREMQLEELKKLQTQVVDQARDMEQQVNAQLSSVESSLNQSLLPAGELPSSATEGTFTPVLPAEGSPPNSPDPSKPTIA